MKRMVPLSRVHVTGRLPLSLDVRRLGESRRVPFSLSSPTYVSFHSWALATTRCLPSLLTLGPEALAPDQLVIFVAFPEGDPVRRSAMIAQRFTSRPKMGPPDDE